MQYFKKILMILLLSDWLEFDKHLLIKKAAY